MRAAILLLALAACDPFEDLPWDADLPDPCDGPPAIDVAGRWSLAGEGESTGCEWDDDGTSPATVEIEALDVIQAENGALSLQTERTGVTFSGQVEGSCVRAEIVDAGWRHAFQTTSGTAGFLSGSFVSRGEGLCRIEGEFTLQID